MPWHIKRSVIYKALLHGSREVFCCIGGREGDKMGRRRSIKIYHFGAEVNGEAINARNRHTLDPLDDVNTLV